jgi:tRNA threonylcarbamoyladenosine biosynthesis protein TsaE
MNEAHMTFRINELTELDAISMRLLEVAKDSRVWLFSGHMGAGKTTLIKSLCKCLGVSSVVQSPTFALVNEYIGDEEQIIYHFDFYRIRYETEALDMGVEEYFDSGGFCFVEWPEKIESLWPERYLHLVLNLNEEGHRTLEVEEIGRT